MKHFLIAISGGSGSGKTTFAKELTSKFIDKYESLILSTDDYYKDQSDIEFSVREKRNYDHPSSIDNEVMKKQLELLVNGIAVDIPQYCFKTHTRLSEKKHIEPKQIIILDGIFSLCYENINPLFNSKIFIDVPEDLRYARRLKRDMEKRARTKSQVDYAWNTFVKPMHDLYMESCKNIADIIVNEYNRQQSIGRILDSINSNIL